MIPDEKAIATARNRHGCGGGFISRCPAHPGRMPSLSFHDVAGSRLTTIQELRRELYERAEHTADLYELIRREGLDRRMIEAHAGVLVACQVQFFPNRRFEMVDHGTPAAVIEAFGEDDCTTIDLVAWPLNKPEQLATALGYAGGVGLARVRNPAAYFGGRPLRVYRTPLAWLKAGCRGVGVLREESAFLWLAAALGDLAAVDLAHGRMLHRALHPFFEPSRILVPQGGLASNPQR